MNPRFVDTTRKQRASAHEEPQREPVLVIAHHPQLARVGEHLVVDAITELSRLAPAFPTGPLDDPFVSRQPITLRRVRAGIEIANPHALDVAVGGAQVSGERRLTPDELSRGIDMVLGGRIVLWLALEAEPDTGPDLNLIGRSSAMRALRDDVRAAAQLDTPVLVTGETGSGKELVARALHAESARAANPLVVVNVAAIPAAVAASELFGHERGAFTGAGERRAGYFERANGGVLFLDEIGELAETIQPMLLRVLESGEIQPVGGQPRQVDVRVVAATDADLARSGGFRAPLYYRLAATTIAVPPLRERGVDIALLFARFLLAELPRELADQTTAATPWLPAALVAELLRRPWPGNVRELKHVASRLAAVARSGRIARSDDIGGFDDDAEPANAPELHSAPGAAADAPKSHSAPGARAIDNARAIDDARPIDDDRATDDARPIDDDRLLSALRAHRFQLSRTAEELGISRTHLDALIAKSSRVRKAKDLDRAEIEACAATHAGDIDAMAAALQVSPRGLKLRMRQLGL